MFPSRVMVVDTDVTYMEGEGMRSGYYDTPRWALTDINALVTSASQSALSAKVGEITVILEPNAAAKLGFPKKVPTNEKTVKGHPLLKTLRDGGWRVSSLTPWMTVWVPERAAVHIGVGPWLHQANNALHADNAGNLAYRLASFQHFTGAAFHGNPGLPALTVLRSLPRPRDDRRRPIKVEWKPRWNGCVPAHSDCERAFAKYLNPNPAGLPFQHGYDATRQYLAAASNTLVTVGELRRTGPRDFNRAIAGYWKIVAPAWNLPGLPNPSGYEAGAECWVTSPTLELLEDLDRMGYLAFPEILETWTSQENVRQFFRPWAERITASYTASLKDTTLDGEFVTDAIKGMYKVGIGLMHATEDRTVCRPDWHHSIIAKARANMFRKIFAVREHMGILPVEISYDKVWYECEHGDPDAWHPLRKDRKNEISPAFPVGDNLGSFTVEVRKA